MTKIKSPEMKLRKGDVVYCEKYDQLAIIHYESSVPNIRWITIDLIGSIEIVWLSDLQLIGKL